MRSGKILPAIVAVGALTAGAVAMLVLVNDSIVLIERFNMNLAEGQEFFTAIEQAGVRRFRAIILTTASTCAGVVPMLLDNSFHTQVMIPMVLSLASGLAFGTVITLFLIPACIVVMNDARRLLARVLTGEWKSREYVEPAACKPALDGPDQPAINFDPSTV